MVSKEKVWQGLKLELANSELCKISQADNFEKDDYYNFDIFLKAFYKTMNKEINFKYFSNWCILVANVLNYTKTKFSTKLGKLILEIADFFDGISFEDKYNKKNFLKNIAYLKHYNYLVQKEKKETITPFETNGIERILLFHHHNRNLNSNVYKLIIKDNKRKKWSIKFFNDLNFEYDDKINYSFVNNEEFEKIFDAFFDDKSDWKETFDNNF